MQLVRLQRIAMKVPRNFDDVNTPLAQFQRTMRINVLQEELNSFKNSLPRNLQQNRRHLLQMFAILMKSAANKLVKKQPRYS